MRSISPSLSTSQGNTKFHHPFSTVRYFFENFPLSFINAQIPSHSRESTRSLSLSLSISVQTACFTNPALANSGLYVAVTSVNFPVPSFCNKKEGGVLPYSQGTALHPMNRSMFPSPLKSVGTTEEAVTCISLNASAFFLRFPFPSFR